MSLLEQIKNILRPETTLASFEQFLHSVWLDRTQDPTKNQNYCQIVEESDNFGKVYYPTKWPSVAIRSLESFIESAFRNNDDIKNWSQYNAENKPIWTDLAIPIQLDYLVKDPTTYLPKPDKDIDCYLFVEVRDDITNGYDEYCKRTQNAIYIYSFKYSKNTNTFNIKFWKKYYAIGNSCEIDNEDE